MMQVGLLFVAVLLWWTMRHCLLRLRVFSVIAACGLYGMMGAYSSQLDLMDLNKEAKNMAQSLKTTEGTSTILNQLKSLAEQKSDQPEAWFWYGRVAAGSGALEQAKLAFSKAYKLDPDSIFIAIQYANALIASEGVYSGDLQKLMTRLETQFPNDRHRLFLSAELALKLDEFDRFQKNIDALHHLTLNFDQNQALKELEQRSRPH